MKKLLGNLKINITITLCLLVLTALLSPSRPLTVGISCFVGFIMGSLQSYYAE